MNRSADKARSDLHRVLREGEEILSFCTSEPVESQWYHGGAGTVTTSYVFTTNARLVRMSANNDSMLCIRWKYFTNLAVARKRFKHTFAFSFSRPSFSSPIDYPAEYVSAETAKVISRIKSGTLAVVEVPDETVSALRVSRPHSDTPLGSFAAASGLPEFKVVCSVCGFSAGRCIDETSYELFDECEGCLRHFSQVEIC